MEHIIKIQPICRRWLVHKHNIISKLKKQQSVFESVISGYHLINKTPIKETVWEEINCDIVCDAFRVFLHSFLDAKR